jgi:hypothetical protein
VEKKKQVWIASASWNTYSMRKQNLVEGNAFWSPTISRRTSPHDRNRVVIEGKKPASRAPFRPGGLFNEMPPTPFPPPECQTPHLRNI